MWSVAVGLGLALFFGGLGPSGPAMADAVTDVTYVNDRPTAIAVNPVTHAVHLVTAYGVTSTGAGTGQVETAGDPVDVAVNSVTNKIYVSTTSGNVSVVDGVTYGAAVNVPVGVNPGVLAVDESNNKIYVGLRDGVSVIDGQTNTATKAPVTGDVRDIQVNPATKKAYVLAGGVLYVIDSSGKAASSINIGSGGILSVAVNEATNTVYFTTLARYGASIRVVDGATDKVTNTIPMSNNVGKVAVNSQTNTIFVAADTAWPEGAVKVIDGASRNQIAQIKTPSVIRDIVLNETSNKAYTLLSGRGVTIIDGQDNIARSVYSGWEPLTAAVDAAADRTYVVNAGSTSLAVIDDSRPTPMKNDFNSDGTADVLARDASGVLWLYPGDGSGGWLPRRAVGQGWNVMTELVTPGDFDGDGHADVLARDASGVLWLYPGNGSSGWLPRSAVGQGWNAMSAIVAIGDFEGDITRDIAARDSSGTLWVYRGDGSGGWQPRVWAGYGWNGMSEITGVDDFNGDGVHDVVARDGSGALWLYQPNGYGSWLGRTAIGQGWNSMNSLVGPGDFDGDGRADILARNAAGELWLYSGQWGSAWPPATRVGTGWNGMTAIL